MISRRGLLAGACGLIASGADALPSRPLPPGFRPGFRFLNPATPAPSLTWDPAFTSTAITLSNNNLTAKNCGTGSDKQTRFNKACPSGKSFVAAYYNSGPSDPGGFGLANASAGIDQGYFGGRNFTMGYYKVGTLIFPDHQLSVNAYNPGDRVEIAYDGTAKLLWARSVTNGTPASWNGSTTANPATGVGGQTFDAGTAPFFGAVNANGGSQWTVTQDGTPPAGFAYPS